MLIKAMKHPQPEILAMNAAVRYQRFLCIGIGPRIGKSTIGGKGIPGRKGLFIIYLSPQLTAFRIPQIVFIRFPDMLCQEEPAQKLAGRAGMQPSLALVYGSRGKNDQLGVGWQLDGLSTIGRCPTTFATEGRADGVRSDEGSES